MTFGNSIENGSSVNAALSLKVSYGGEIRRATYTDVSFVGLRDLVANLFGLDSTSVVLKYEDDDGDKITMSSDVELKEAIQGTNKEKNLLRLLADVKPVTVVAVPLPAEGEKAPEFPFMPRGGLGGFHRGFGHGPHHGHGPHPHGPHHGPGSHGPHGHGHGPHPHGHGPRGHHPHGPHAFGPHHHRGGFHAFGAHPGFPGRHFPFVPVSEQERGPHCGKEAHKLFKERKHAMKQQLKLMKENATTPEDKKAIKELKVQMMAERNHAKWHAHHAHHAEKKLKKAMKHDRFVAKHVADVTIPDNSGLAADTPATKTWRLRNVGNNAWPADSQLIFISHRGDNLNGPERVLVGAVEPQAEVDVSISFLTPKEPGRYVGYYRMATGDGSKFGQRVWVSFFVPYAPTVNANANANMAFATDMPVCYAPLATDVAMD